MPEGQPVTLSCGDHSSSCKRGRRMHRQTAATSAAADACALCCAVPCCVFFCRLWFTRPDTTTPWASSLTCLRRQETCRRYAARRGELFGSLAGSTASDCHCQHIDRQHSSKSPLPTDRQATQQRVAIANRLIGSTAADCMRAHHSRSSSRIQGQAAATPAHTVLCGAVLCLIRC